MATSVGFGTARGGRGPANCRRGWPEKSRYPRSPDTARPSRPSPKVFLPKGRKLASSTAITFQFAPGALAGFGKILTWQARRKKSSTELRCLWFDAPGGETTQSCGHWTRRAAGCSASGGGRVEGHHAAANHQRFLTRVAFGEGGYLRRAGDGSHRGPIFNFFPESSLCRNNSAIRSLLSIYRVAVHLIQSAVSCSTAFLQGVDNPAIRGQGVRAALFRQRREGGD